MTSLSTWRRVTSTFRTSNVAFTHGSVLKRWLVLYSQCIRLSVKVPEGIFLCETADLHSSRNFMQQLHLEFGEEHGVLCDQPLGTVSKCGVLYDCILNLGKSSCCMKFRLLCKSAVSHKKIPSGTLTDNLIHWLYKTSHRFKTLPCVKATFDVRKVLVTRRHVLKLVMKND